MSLGAGVFASVVLILLVYNKGFRRVFLWVAAISAGVGLMWYGYVKYRNYAQAKQVAAHKRLVDACVVRHSAAANSGQWMDYVDDVQGTCETNPNYDWRRSESANSQKVIQIHGGEELDIVSGEKMPIVYLRPRQKFTLICASEVTKDSLPVAPVKDGVTSCP
jgi:hypothetical protein